MFGNILILSVCVLSCTATLTDYMQIYEEECLGEDKIHCADGSCVWKHQYCDGYVDCPDGSDENLCENHTVNPELCTDNNFLCADHSKCIPNIWLCNNLTECLDGSDEANCTAPIQPDTPVVNKTCKGFTCRSDGLCISSLWRCDGKYDCADHSDESADSCRHRRPLGLAWRDCPDTLDELGKKRYQCADGSECLLPRHMCDGLRDCKDGSDEGPFCDKWKTMCVNVTCGDKATCHPSRRGAAECVCPLYHQYDAAGARCAALDMCAAPRPPCSQLCEDKGRGAHICHCEEGYTPDYLLIGYVCFAPEPEGKLFFSTSSEIKYLLLKTKKIVTVATGLNEAHGVASDGVFVYWVETAQGHQAIVKAPLDNFADTKTVLVGLGLEDPGDISIDQVGGNFYFSDAARGAITACRLERALCATVHTDARVPKHLTLDITRGKMYWADWHDGRPVIMSAYMDGAAPAVLVSALEQFPAGLAADPPGGRLYFIDGTLKGARMDDGRVFTVDPFVPTYHAPRALAVFENSVYWSDWASDTIQSWQKMDGTSHGPAATLHERVNGLSVFHPILGKAGPQPPLVNCSQLRLLGASLTLRCACADGWQLDHTNTSCVPMESSRPEYVVVGAGSSFTLVQYNAVGAQPASAVTFDIGRVQAMAYDTKRDVLYVYDAMWKAISAVQMRDFHHGTAKMIWFMGLDNVVDMDYDYMTDNLYFLDAGRKFIEVISLNTGVRATIFRFDQETPISFCLVPEHGKMLVAVVENEQNEDIHIDSFSLDGSGRRHLFMSNLKGPHIQLKYSRKMDNVYLSDEGNCIIDHFHPEGTARENFRSLSTAVTHLAVTDTLVLWSTRRSHRLYWADIRDTSRAVSRAELSMFPNTTQVLLQATWQPADIPAHPCQSPAPPCSDVCVQTPGDSHHPEQSGVTPVQSTLGYKCLCTPGLVNVDGKCTEPSICMDEEAYCHISNVCIEKNLLCDGKKDCQHGEDEEGCISSTTLRPSKNCAWNEKLCDDICVDRNVACVPTTTMASANSISTTEPEQLECLPSEFPCPGGALCVQRSSLCDGARDCPDGGDEAQALCDTLNCRHTEFMCTSGQCIIKSFKCDGEVDCNDGSDEFNCSNKTCAQRQFQCRNFECIDETKRCDAQQDCSDFSDEDNCQYPYPADWGNHDNSSTKEEPEPEECPEWEYPCELNKSICLPLTARCNGKQDCPGHTDEANCWVNCHSDNLVHCRHEMLCLPRRKVCDGQPDCAGGADETQEFCDHVNRTSQLYPALPASECREGYWCASGQCIEWRSVCDQRADCADGSDEGGRCLSSCLNHNCSYSCQPTPLGRVCACGAGFALQADGAACADVDECARAVCAQRCRNTPGSFLCSCHRGYALRSDRRSCKAESGDMSLIYASGDSVRSMALGGQVSAPWARAGGAVAQLAYDVRRRKLYVTSADDGKLVQVDGNSKIVVTNVGRPTKMALDWITGNVYFADMSPAAPRMRVCNVERRRCAALQNLPLHSNVTALVLDPLSRKMFYCVCRALECVVWAAEGAGGAGRRAAQLAVLGRCAGLALDTYSKRIYVAEANANRLYTMDYEGNFLNEIIKDEQHLQAPHDLAIFEDYIYFLDGKTSKLTRCLLFGKKHCEMYFERVFEASSFLINHESMQRNDVPDYCEGESCDNLCVQGDLRGICLCDEGSVSKDGTCALVTQQELPLFDGTTYRDYQNSHTSTIVIGLVSALFVLYIGGFLYYNFVYRKRREEDSDYVPVHFRNSPAEGSTVGFGESPPATTSPVALEAAPSGSTTNEFTNPMQLFNKWRASFKKDVRPVGTAGLKIDVPSLNVSDTESDLDDMEDKKIIKKK